MKQYLNSNDEEEDWKDQLNYDAIMSVDIEIDLKMSVNRLKEINAIVNE